MLFDGNFTSALSWGWYWSENPVYNIDIQLPKQQSHLKFGYYVPVSSTFRAPAEIKCYTKATAEGKWVELTTLNVTNDSLPVKVPEDPSLKYVQFTSKEYKAPATFNYVRFAFEKVSEQKGDVFTEEMQPRNPQISEWVMYDVFYKDE